MKRKLLAVFLALITALCFCFGPAGCGGVTPKEYTIQYSDDAGTHTLTVTKGMPYSLESVPYKFGYEFLGLYDAQTGGTQYVDANGASLSPFKDKANKVLFPRFKPIDYTVILDYGEAKATGDRSFTVPYNESLPELPKDLSLEHNVFTGWYTESDGKGMQVADAYGNLPLVSVMNEENFKLDESKRVYLYAGFELEKYTVTFYFDDGMPSEEVKVPYNTPISQIVPKTRNSEKKAGLTWSTRRGGDTFSGNITDNIVLYVKEWAPVIELNGNGADVTPIVAKAGTAISLPTPTKPLAKFLHWEDENGKTKDITTMPDESITLNAVWQGKIELDENGGTDVDDISKPAGESITLPTPEKEGYLFAGWYTSDKEQYTQTKMPAAGIALKAGWYKTKSFQKILLNETDKVELSDRNFRYTSKTYNIDLSTTIDNFTVGMIIAIELHFQYMNEDNTGYYDVTLANSPDISTLTLYWEEQIYANGNTNYQAFDDRVTITTSSSALYLKFRPLPYGGDVYTTMKDLYYTIYYPDTSYLYL